MMAVIYGSLRYPKPQLWSKSAISLLFLPLFMTKKKIFFKNTEYTQFNT